MWLNLKFPSDLFTFTEEILMENFVFCAVLVVVNRLASNGGVTQIY